MTNDDAERLARVCLVIAEQHRDIGGIWFAYRPSSYLHIAIFPEFALLVVVPSGIEDAIKSNLYVSIHSIILSAFGSAAARTFYFACISQYELEDIPSENRICLL